MRQVKNLRSEARILRTKLLTATAKISELARENKSLKQKVNSLTMEIYKLKKGALGFTTLTFCANDKLEKQDMGIHYGSLKEQQQGSNSPPPKRNRTDRDDDPLAGMKTEPSNSRLSDVSHVTVTTCIEVESCDSKNEEVLIKEEPIHDDDYALEDAPSAKPQFGKTYSGGKKNRRQKPSFIDPDDDDYDDESSSSLNAEGSSNFASQAVAKALRQPELIVPTTLDCSHADEMKNGLILLVRDFLRRNGTKDETKCGFREFNYSALGLNKKNFRCGWKHKLLKFTRDYDFVGLTWNSTIGKKRNHYFDVESRVFFVDEANTIPFTMDADHIYVHIVQRRRRLPEEPSIKINELAIMDVHNSEEHRHLLNTGAFSYIILRKENSRNFVPPMEKLPHPTVHSKDCSESLWK